MEWPEVCNNKILTETVDVAASGSLAPSCSTQGAQSQSVNVAMWDPCSVLPSCVSDELVDRDRLDLDRRAFELQAFTNAMAQHDAEVDVRDAEVAVRAAEVVVVHAEVAAHACAHDAKVAAAMMDGTGPHLDSLEEAQLHLALAVSAAETRGAPDNVDAEDGSQGLVVVEILRPEQEQGALATTSGTAFVGAQAHSVGTPVPSLLVPSLASSTAIATKNATSLDMLLEGVDSSLSREAWGSLLHLDASHLDRVSRGSPWALRCEVALGTSRVPTCNLNLREFIALTVPRIALWRLLFVAQTWKLCFPFAE